MDRPIRTYGAIGWILAGLAVAVGSLTMETVTLTAFVAVVGLSLAVLGGFLLREQVTT